MWRLYSLQQSDQSLANCGAFPSDLSSRIRFPSDMSLGNPHWGNLDWDTIPNYNPQRK
ncbi:hypothetical protein Tco_0470422, partial [Tanacetum coccineum]